MLHTPLIRVLARCGACPESALHPGRATPPFKKMKPRKCLCAHAIHTSLARGPVLRTFVQQGPGPMRILTWHSCVPDAVASCCLLVGDTCVSNLQALYGVAHVPHQTSAPGKLGTSRLQHNASEEASAHTEPDSNSAVCTSCTLVHFIADPNESDAIQMSHAQA